MVKANYWEVDDAQVMAKTGHPLSHWTGLLDAFEAADKASKSAVELLQKTHGVPRFWARTLVTRYLKSKV